MATIEEENVKRSTLFRPITLRRDKGHRQATWLELFFDLAFVVSIAALTAMLAKNPTLVGLAVYICLFCPVFWAWNQLTWYASHFDNDDVFFRVMYLGVILSVLILAASVEKISKGDTTLFVTSYVLIQSCLAAGWTRVYINNFQLRSFSLKFLIGPVVGGMVWLVSLGLPFPQQYYAWVIAMVIQVSAPYIAWKTTTFEIPIHIDHIVERYCLFTIIVMGETLVAVSAGSDFTAGSGAFLTAVFAYVVVACIWWTYFNWDFSEVKIFGRISNLFAFGYGHFVIFLLIAAFGAGVEIAIHSSEHGGHSTLLERMLIVLSPPLYLISLSVLNRYAWGMIFDKKMKARIGVAMLSLAFALITPFASPVVLTGGIALLMTCLVCYELIFCAASEG
jgi:low temperature requirement protein LtrA